MLETQFDCSAFARISNESLMEAISERQPHALNEFYSRHRNRLKSVIGNVVHEEGEADDVLQEILIQIWRDARRYSPKAGKMLGWVVTLARRRAIDRLRRRQAYCRAKDRFEEHVEQQPEAWKNNRIEQDIARADIRR